MYETKAMAQAVKEYDDKQSISAFEVATKYGVSVKDLHSEYARYKAQQVVKSDD